MKKFLLTLAILMTAATAMAGHYVIFNPSETPPTSSSPDGTVINHQDGIQISLYGSENGATDECYFFSSYMYIFAFVNPGYRLMSIELVGAPYQMIFEYSRGQTEVIGNSAIWQDGYYDEDGTFHAYTEEDYRNGIVENDPVYYSYYGDKAANGLIYVRFASPNWRVNIDEIKIYVYDPNEEPPTPEYIEVAAPVISTTMDDDNVHVNIEWPESTGEHIYNGEYTYPRSEEAAQYEVEAYVTADGLYLESVHATATIDVPAKVVDPGPQPEEGYYIILIDQFGNEVPVELQEGADGDYTTTYTFEYYPWGEFVWDPNLTEEENEANRPDVPFYFMINGKRYGADVDMRETILGYAMDNPLEKDAEGYYCVPVGFSYTLGVAYKDGDYYVYAAISKPTGVDEVNGEKAVAGVRYFNMVGQEMQEANGMTIVVTTYIDGTTSAVKVMK